MKPPPSYSSDADAKEGRVGGPTHQRSPMASKWFAAWLMWMDHELVAWGGQRSRERVGERGREGEGVWRLSGTPAVATAQLKVELSTAHSVPPTVSTDSDPLALVLPCEPLTCSVTVGAKPIQIW